MSHSSRPRIMVVDDSLSQRTLAKQALESTCELMLCDSGLSAIAQIADFQPDLLFVDIVMPKLDGYETVALVRSNASYAGVPIIMMSSKGGIFDVARGRMLGFSGHITKPFTSADLVECLQHNLQVPA